jgi:hypothetical protein
LKRINLARLFIGVVLLWNVQCALVFLLWPERFTAGFQLYGPAGEAMVQGMGVLFLMWNVPYTVALWNPVRHRISLYEAIAMQAIGLAGEILILFSLPGGYELASTSITRFVIFDAAGLVFLLGALAVSRSQIVLSPPASH